MYLFLKPLLKIKYGQTAVGFQYIFKLFRLDFINIILPLIHSFFKAIGLDSNYPE
jgi:hypothetical protein